MTKKAYKLTDQNDCTYNGCKWGEGVEHTAPGKGDLCTNGWIHCYSQPLLAVFLNPIHGNYDLDSAYLWECEVGGRMQDDHGLKMGVEKCKTVRRIPLPEVTVEQRIKFAILCAKEVCDDKHWNKWADNWLSGKDRTRTSAEEAAERAEAEAAWAAAEAAWAAAWAAAWVTEWAWAAEWAAKASKIDLVKIAEKAVEEK